MARRPHVALKLGRSPTEIRAFAIQLTDGSTDVLHSVHSRSNDLRPARRGLFAAVVDSLLDDGIAVRFRAGGRSMSPAVRDGETVLVAPVDPARIGIGEVVYCRTGRGPLAHRVVAIDPQPDGSRRFTLCGDAAPDCDRPVDARAVRGKVVAVERGSDLVSLAIAGGWLGRFTLVTALGLRRALRATAVRALAAALAPAPARK